MHSSSDKLLTRISVLLCCIYIFHYCQAVRRLSSKNNTMNSNLNDFRMSLNKINLEKVMLKTSFWQPIAFMNSNKYLVVEVFMTQLMAILGQIISTKNVSYSIQLIMIGPIVSNDLMIKFNENNFKQAIFSIPFSFHF